MFFLGMSVLDLFVEVNLILTVHPHHSGPGPGITLREAVAYLWLSSHCSANHVTCT